MAEVGFDFGRATGEGTTHGRVDAGQIRPGALELAPGDSEARRELRPQLGLVEVAGGPQLEKQPPSIESGPPLVRPRRQVRDQHVAVKVRIRRSARPMQERRRNEPPCRHGRWRRATHGRAPHAGAMSLQVPERRSRCFLMARAHLGPHLLGAEGMQQAHRLRRRAGAVEGGDTHAVMVGREDLSGTRVDAGEQRSQCRAVNGPDKAERTRRAPEPAPFGLGEDPRLLPPGGDGRQVVALPPPSHLRNTQHRSLATRRTDRRTYRMIRVTVPTGKLPSSAGASEGVKFGSGPRGNV